MTTFQDSDFIFARGAVIQVREYYEGIGGGFAPTPHQEFWLRYPSGEERHYHMVRWTLPIRHGHVITLIWWRGEWVAIMNHTTEQYINLVSLSPDAEAHVNGEPRLRRHFDLQYGPWDGFKLTPFVIWALALMWALTLDRWEIIVIAVALIVVPLMININGQEKQAWAAELQQLYAAVERQVQRAAGHRV